MWDVSAGGVGLFLTDPVEPGTILHIHFLNAGVADRRAQVVHATPHAEGWLVGCAIDPPFRRAELHALQLWPT
jgi:hypothetical protein